MLKKSLFSNVFYAFLLQFSTLIFPLVTTPYISRVLGPSGLGKVNFASSVVNWFILFSTLGLLSYGVREVSRIRDDKKKLSRFFSEILLLKIIATLIVLAVYVPSIFYIERFSLEFVLFALNGVLLLSNVFSLDWFFQGVEDYKYITIRSIIIKIIAIISIFALVKTEDHYLIYAGITVFTLSIGNIINFIYARKFIRIQIKDLNIKQHLRPLFVFFTTTLVVSVYTLLDQVILGFMKGDSDVAFFARAKMFFNIGMALSVSINNAITPRINNYFVGNKDQYAKLLKTSLNMLILISVPIMFGIGILAQDLMILFGGNEFEPSSIALIIMTPLLVLTPLSIWNYQQRIIPLGYEKIGLYINTVTAITSLFLNIKLVPNIGFVGTAISWVCAECIGLIISLYYSKSKDSYRVFHPSQIKYICLGSLMGIIVWLLNSLLSLSWTNLFICIAVGGFSYITFLIIIRDQSTMFIIGFIKDKLKN